MGTSATKRASPRACTRPSTRARASCRCASTRPWGTPSIPGAVPASTDAEDHAVPRAHGGALRQPFLAALGGVRGGELLRALARARVPRDPQLGGAVRHL